MKRFRIVPLAEEVAEKIRTTMKDDYDHDLSYQEISGRALCRFCLNDGAPPQRRILFSYRPFKENKNPYSEVGPVFIHDHCEQYKNIHVFPSDLKKRDYLQLRGYDTEQNIVIGELTEGQTVEKAIEKLFANSSIEYLHIRDGKTGCYFLKIERG